MRRCTPMVVFVLVVSACGGSNPAPPGDAAGTVPSTATAALEPDPFEASLEARLDDDGSVPFAAAADMFASVFGPFPGGNGSAFPDPGPHAATLAVASMARYLDELSPEQTAAFDAVVNRAPEAEALPDLVDSDRLRLNRQPVRDYEALALAARDEIAARVGRTLSIPMTIETRSGTDHWAIASPRRDGAFVGEGIADECLIELWPERLSGGDFARSVITHEVFHCFQYTAYDDLALTWETAPWITEGQAFWAAAEIVGGEQAWVIPAYAEWLCRPEISLWKRVRPAMGFYSTVATHGEGDLWTRLDDMLGLSREAAVTAAGIPATDALRFVATGRMRDVGAFDAPWTLDGAGQSADPCRETASASPDAPWQWSEDIQSFASGLPIVVTLEGEVVRADAAGGAGAFEFSDGTLVPWSGAFAGVFCMLDEGCECPDGRRIGEAVVRPGETAVAVGGGPGTVSASFVPFTLEDACLEIADVPRMTLVGDPEVELAGGVCVLDGGDLILSIGYEAEYDGLQQPPPHPNLRVIIFVRAVPGTWDTGSVYVAPTGGEFRMGDGGLVITLSDDLLTGTFSWNNASGSYSCPRLWTPEEAAAGPPTS